MEIIDGYTPCGLSKYEPIEEVRKVMAGAVANVELKNSVVIDYDV